MIDSYAFSGSPQIVRHRGGAAEGGDYALYHDCADFSRTAGGARPAIVALLHASGGDGKSSGKAYGAPGEESFPSLGFNVAPKVGRLLLLEVRRE